MAFAFFGCFGWILTLALWFYASVWFVIAVYLLMVGRPGLDTRVGIEYVLGHSEKVVDGTESPELDVVRLLTLHIYVGTVRSAC